MSKERRKSQPEPGNRFADLMEDLNKQPHKDALSDYLTILDSIGESDKSEPIPFPYGGSRDFGKWAKNGN